eukprot:TRINITY_DN6877_c0_g1_i2.p1 TRINITY_DN6877_c0_g1~~TRINITY_DN6877_c0_g1_i2.p1  ORF type:complete len:358 (-),score=96.87 TRINITY_DN6877_c0_g1_i2:128-1201(-)
MKMKQQNTSEEIRQAIRTEDGYDIGKMVLANTSRIIDLEGLFVETQQSMDMLAKEMESTNHSLLSQIKELNEIKAPQVALEKLERSQRSTQKTVALLDERLSTKADRAELQSLDFAVESFDEFKTWKNNLETTFNERVAQQTKTEEKVEKMLENSKRIVVQLEKVEKDINTKANEVELKNVEDMISSSIASLTERDEVSKSDLSNFKQNVQNSFAEMVEKFNAELSSLSESVNGVADEVNDTKYQSNHTIEGTKQELQSEIDNIKVSLPEFSKNVDLQSLEKSVQNLLNEQQQHETRLLIFEEFLVWYHKQGKPYEENLKILQNRLHTLAPVDLASVASSLPFGNLNIRNASMDGRK